MAEHHPACEVNSGGACNCMHPRVVVMRSATGDSVSFADYLALESKIANRDETIRLLELSVAELKSKLTTALQQLETTGAEVDAAGEHAANQAAIINDLSSRLDAAETRARLRTEDKIALQTELDAARSRLQAALDWLDGDDMESAVLSLDAAAHLREILTGSVVEIPVSKRLEAERALLASAPSLKDIAEAQNLCNCHAKEGERHSDGCNTLSRLVQIGALSE